MGPYITGVDVGNDRPPPLTPLFVWSAGDVTSGGEVWITLLPLSLSHIGRLSSCDYFWLLIHISKLNRDV